MGPRAPGWGAGSQPSGRPGQVPSRQVKRLTFEEADAGVAGFPAEGVEGQHEGAVSLGRLQVGAALVQEHHGVVQPLVEAGAHVFVGQDVLQPHGALGPPPDDGAQADVVGAADVRGVEGEEGAAVEEQAGPVLQQTPQRLAIQGAHVHVDHNRRRGASGQAAREGEPSSRPGGTIGALFCLSGTGSGFLPRGPGASLFLALFAPKKKQRGLQSKSLVVGAFWMDLARFCSVSPKGSGIWLGSMEEEEEKEVPLAWLFALFVALAASPLSWRGCCSFLARGTRRLAL